MASLKRVLVGSLAFNTVFAVAPNASWEHFVVGPKSSTAYPHSIYNTTGNVTNANGLLHGGGSPAVLTRPSSGDTPPAIIVDFGINTVGFLQIDFAGASDNHPGLRLAFSETLQYLSNVSDFSRSQNGDAITPGSDQIAVSAKKSTWTDQHKCDISTSKQVCADGLHGFRYVNIYLDALESDAPYTQSNGSISISAIRLNYTGLIAPHRGVFQCSDAQLTQYWFDGAYTNEMVTDTFRSTDVDPRNSSTPSLEGKQVLFDGAKRDRDPYVGDLGVSALTDYYTHYLGAPVKNVLADLGAHQRSDGWIPPASINNYTLPLFDYPLWWAYTSWQYVLYTGDTVYAHSQFPAVQRLLDGWCLAVTNASSSLLSKGLDNTDSYGDYAFLPRTAEVTYYNALYVLALQAGASLANVIGDHASAANWTARASMVRASINAQLWDDAVGAYFDSSNSTTRHGQDGNSLAVLAGVANATRASSSLSYLSKLAQPYGNAFFDTSDLVPDARDRVYAFLSYFEIAARFESGDDHGALEETRRLFGYMAAHDPQHTFWEGIGANGSLYEQGFTSCAHGWSTGVTPALSQYVLGVKPTQPGYAAFNVTPSLGDLDWAKGTVPTPNNGEIDVSWKRSPKDFTLNLTIPSHTQAQVNLPLDFASNVTVNGKPCSVTPHSLYASLESTLAAGTWVVVGHKGKAS